MRAVIAVALAFSLCVYLGCGSGSGVKNVSEADFSKIGGNLASESDPNAGAAGRPSPQRPAPTSGQSSSSSSKKPDPSKGPAPDASAAALGRIAAEGPVETPPAAENKTPPAAQQTAPAATASGSKAPAGATGGALSRFAEEGPVEESSGAAAPAGQPAQTQPSQDDGLTSAIGNALSRGTPPGGNPSGAGIAGRKGASVTALSEGASGGAIAGGKGGATVGNGGVPAVAEVTPKTLLDKAAESFKVFKETEAEQYLYGYWLTEPGAIGKYPIQWVEGISEPRIFFRWGIGVVFDAPADFDGRPPVIGDPAPPSTSSANRAGGRGGRGAAGLTETSQPSTPSPYANVDRSTPTGNLVFYTGDYGERLINRLNKRRLHAEAYYGKILALNDLSPKNDVNNRSTTTTITDPGISDPSHAILIGDEVGPTTRTVTATAPANRTTNTSGVAASTGTVIPGVVFLGVETDSNADQIFIDQAKAAGLDGLLLFHVSVKTKGKSSPPYSVTVLSVHNLKKSDDVLKASSLSSETVAKTREKNRKESDDPVELQLDKIFKGFSDDKLRVSAMPELKPEIAKKRVETLSGETHGNPLPVVGEIMSYHKSGLVDEATAVAAIAKILGNQDAATKLVTGSEDEKKAAIEKWMPENFKLSDSPAGDFR